jgi:hypothetical protein
VGSPCEFEVVDQVAGDLAELLGDGVIGRIDVHR